MELWEIGMIAGAGVIAFFGLITGLINCFTGRSKEKLAIEQVRIEFT